MNIKSIFLVTGLVSLVHVTLLGNSDTIQLNEGNAEYAAICPTREGILCKVYHLLFAGKKPAQVRAEMNEALAPHPENEPIKNELELDQGVSDSAAICGSGGGILCSIYRALFKGHKPAEVKAAIEKQMEGHPEDEPLPPAPTTN